MTTLYELHERLKAIYIREFILNSDIPPRELKIEIDTSTFKEALEAAANAANGTREAMERLDRTMKDRQ